jgi:membrane protease YdiL (CAAX protease family)
MGGMAFPLCPDGRNFPFRCASSLVFINLLAMSIIYTWIFINTNGSLLLPLLFHAAGNTTSNLLPILPPAALDLRIYYFTIAINCVIAITVIFLSKSLQSSQKLSLAQ